MRRPSGMSDVRIGVLALVVVLVGCYLGFTKAIPFRDHFELRAVFRTSNDIRPGSPVRIAGVNVGKVVRVEPERRGSESATVWMRIDDKGRPIHADAHAAIRPRIFLEGNFFVDLTAGSPSAPALGDGDVIGVGQTSTPVQLDQVLTALQSDSRADLQTVLREYAGSLRGRGARGFRRSLRYWAPAYRDGARVADATLGETEHALSGYLRGAERVARALDAAPQQLKGLVTDFNATARAFATHDRSLRGAVAELPRTLHAGMPALARLNASFPALRALARDLRPGVRNSTPALEAATPLVRELRGLVAPAELRGLVGDLRPAVPALARLSAATVPLYEQVRLASSCQNEVILPWSRDTVPDEHFRSSGPVYEEALKPLPGLAGESRSGDANGQWFRVLSAGGTNLVTLKPGVYAATAAPFLGTNPPAPKDRPPLDATVPCETQQKPDLRTKVGAPPPQRKVDVTSAVYEKRYALAKAHAVKWLRKVVKQEGLAKLLKVADTDVTAGLVDRLAEQVQARQARLRATIDGGRP